MPLLLCCNSGFVSTSECGGVGLKADKWLCERLSSPTKAECDAMHLMKRHETIRLCACSLVFQMWSRLRNAMLRRRTHFDAHAPTRRSPIAVLSLPVFSSFALVSLQPHENFRRPCTRTPRRLRQGAPSHQAGSMALKLPRDAHAAGRRWRVAARRLTAQVCASKQFKKRVSKSYSDSLHLHHFRSQPLCSLSPLRWPYCTLLDPLNRTFNLTSACSSFKRASFQSRWS